MIYIGLYLTINPIAVTTSRDVLLCSSKECLHKAIKEVVADERTIDSLKLREQKLEAVNASSKCGLCFGPLTEEVAEGFEYIWKYHEMFDDIEGMVAYTPVRNRINTFWIPNDSTVYGETYGCRGATEITIPDVVDIDALVRSFRNDDYHGDVLKRVAEKYGDDVIDYRYGIIHIDDNQVQEHYNLVDSRAEYEKSLSMVVRCKLYMMMKLQ